MSVKDGFTFYRSYYRQGIHLKDRERHQFYDDIINYMFEDKPPVGNNYVLGAFEGIQHNLDKSRTNSGNGAGKAESELESNANRMQIEMQSENDKGKNESSSNTLSVTDSFTTTDSNVFTNTSSVTIYKSISDLLTDEEENVIRKHLTDDTEYKEVLEKIDEAFEGKDFQSIKNRIGYFRTTARDMGFQWK